MPLILSPTHLGWATNVVGVGRTGPVARGPSELVLKHGLLSPHPCLLARLHRLLVLGENSCHKVGTLLTSTPRAGTAASAYSAGLCVNFRDLVTADHPKRSSLHHILRQAKKLHRERGSGRIDHTETLKRRASTSASASGTPGALGRT